MNLAYFIDDKFFTKVVNLMKYTKPVEISVGVNRVSMGGKYFILPIRDLQQNSKISNCAQSTRRNIVNGYTVA